MYNGRMTPVSKVLELKQLEAKKEQALKEHKEDNREALSEEYKELFGKRPSSNIKIETLKAKIAEAKATV